MALLVVAAFGFSQVYVHDSSGYPVSGSIDDLIRSVEEGKNISVLYARSVVDDDGYETKLTWLRECDGVGVQGQVVHCFVMCVADTEVRAYGRELNFQEFEHHIFRSNGISSFVVFKLGTGNRIKGAEGQRRDGNLTWFAR